MPREDSSVPDPDSDSATTLRVTGMTCQNCRRHVHEALAGVPGVASVEVNLEKEMAVVHWRPGAPNDDALLSAAVRSAGYQSESLIEGSLEQTASAWRFNLLAGVVLTVPMMIGEWVFGLGLERWYHWAAFCLATPVQLYCGARFYRGAWLQAKVGGSNMDTLVVLGSTTAYAYSVAALLTGTHMHLFFMESASIISLISLGHWMESMISAKAALSMRALLNLAPATARRVNEAGVETEVPLATVVRGDHVVVKPGDRIPTDASVIEGASSVDESMLTGESKPVDKLTGATVFAGTQNLHGRLLLSVTGTGRQTALAHITSIVERAQNSRAAIQNLVDRISNVFVPIVIAIALLTGLFWYFMPEMMRSISTAASAFLWNAHQPAGRLASAVYHTASVLIIACPCAMGLATPIAIMAGTNAASRLGILIRDSQALEKSGRITAVMLDKTGTLTAGRHAVAAFENYDLPHSPPAHDLAAALAQMSQHPLSRAIAASGSSAAVITHFREVPGGGVQGEIQLDSGSGKAAALLGSLSWLQTQGVQIPARSAFISLWEPRGATIVGFAFRSTLGALFALKDTLKPGAGEIIAELQAAGKKVYLVTGDTRTTALAVAQEIGIDGNHVFAGVKPGDKSALIERLRAEGDRVAFVGDGINDAPALAAADLGIAVSRASDVAREAADIVLLASDIHAIPAAIALAQATLRTIKQNLFWAFFYNAAAIPLAVFGFVSPIVSTLAMGGSDFVVIGNALRLRNTRLGKVTF